MIAGILIGHGELPIVLNRTIQKIMGEQDNFLVISNENCSGAELQKRLNSAVAELNKNDVIIFVDLFGSSCANVSNQLLRNPTEQKIGIICGVNTAMLIKYFQYREQKSFSELLRLLEETGRNEIRATTSK